MSAAPKTDLPESDSPATAPRSWWQFSLRTMFVIVTLLVIFLAWFVSGPERQRRAVAEIVAGGGSVTYQGDDGSGPPAETPWIPRDYYCPVDWVYMGGPSNPDLLSFDINVDPYFPLLKDLPYLRAIMVDGQGLSDAGLAHLAEITSLESLDISSAQITDAGLQSLRNLKRLKWLRLPASITDAGLVHLAELDALEYLDLEGARIQGAGLAHLRGLSFLKDLRLRLTEVGDESLQHLLAIRSLSILDLGKTKVTMAGLNSLEALPKLEYIAMDDLNLPLAERNQLGDRLMKRASPRPVSSPAK